MGIRHTGTHLATVILLLLLVATGIAIAQQNGSGGSARGDDFDLDGLIERVSKSKALGFLTKLSLKGDIDRFLGNVEKYHKGTGDLTLDELHERYDALVHNLVVLVQDKDQDLVKSIDDGRDKLWALLADGKKFATL